MTPGTAVDNARGPPHTPTIGRERRQPRKVLSSNTCNRPTNPDEAASTTTAPTLLFLSKLTENETSDIANSSYCGLDLRKAELPVIFLITLSVNLLALAVLLRMRGTCDTLDHHLVSLLNLNDLISTALFTFMWVSGWASCDQLLQLPVYCGLFGWLGSALVVWSAGIIVIMTSCRYLSLVKPLYYRTHVTVTTVTRGAVGTLLFCLLFFIWPFTGLTAPFTIYQDNHICATQFAPGGAGLGQRIFIGATGVIGCLTVVHVLVCNMTIVKTLRQRNAIRSEVTHSRSDSTRTHVHGKRRIFGHVTLVVSFVYALCYAPFVVRLVIDTIQDVDHQDSPVHSVTLSLLFLSPLLNPVVYGVFNRQFRLTLFAMFRPPVKKPNLMTGNGLRVGFTTGVYTDRDGRAGARVKVPPDRDAVTSLDGGNGLPRRETEVSMYSSSHEMFTCSSG
ncbi:prostaglandin D2 receptor-like [Physella acuta]|uniref:prostaglandin D2 receptor-like n=1 Tax=Physella acuta TaxID=109671 RepID=UPI0027DB73A3|nr:prostaglandin D2 receptor-like [Physella acuta]